VPCTSWLVESFDALFSVRGRAAVCARSGGCVAPVMGARITAIDGTVRGQGCAAFG
jgi:hypothetical protein